MKYNNGVANSPLSEVGESKNESGTEITFFASKKIFSNINYNFGKLETRLRELAYLNTGIKIDFMGHPANTLTSPAVMSLKLRCPIIPLQIIRKEGNFFEIIIRKLL